MNPINTDNNVPPFPAIPSSLQQSSTTISTTTDAITALASQLMENLNERSTALANGANFDLALRDAEVMQAVHPTSSLGYLKAGSIYQQQGRQQEAAAMYEKGLSIVPASDPCYTNLQVDHNDAMNTTSKRVDFISQLPLELVTSEILPLVFHQVKLEADTPCPYLYVSRTWRERILKCSSLSFHVLPMLSEDPFPFNELKRFAAHVKTLFMVGGGPVSFVDLQDPVSAFKECFFANLTNLSIISSECGEDDIINAVESVHRTLTHLVLNVVHDDTPRIHLRAVLELCSSLVSLALTTLTIQPLSMQYPKLTHLTWHTEVLAISNEAMLNMLAHLPSLVYLDILYAPYSQFLTSVCGYCPDLKVLRCGGYATFDHDTYHRDIHGLQKFRFAFNDVFSKHNADHLMPLLHANYESLDHIALVGSVDAAQMATLDERSWNLSLKFNRLEEFGVHAGNDQLATLAVSIIRRSPHLQRVDIWNDTATQDDVSNAVKGLKELHMLSAKKLTHDTTWFRNVLEHHVQLGKNSMLKDLKMDMDPNDVQSPFSWMHLIGRLQSLQKLVMATPKIETPSEYISAIATIAKGCPSLLYLELDFGDHSSPEETIAHLKSHPTLECFHIHAPTVTARDIVNLLFFPNLQHIILNANLEDYLIALLRKHIAQVEHKANYSWTY